MTPVPGHRSMMRSASWRAMVATLLAASAIATPIEAAPQRDTITLNYWTQQVSSRSVGASTEAALKVFEKQNPGVKVHVTTFPYLVFHDKIVTAIRGGQGPDIATLDEPWTPEFAASGTLIPLDSLLASSKVIHRSDFFAGGLTSAEYKGRLWGIPQVSGGWMQFAYNKDMFAKAGITAPPTTWAQFAVDAQKLTKPPAQYAVGLLGDQGEDMVCALNAFINTNGGQIINAAGTKSLINQPAAVQAIRFYTGLAKYAPAGTVSRAQPDALNLFNAGKVAIDMEGPWAQDGYKHGLNWGIAMMPAPQGKSFHACLGGWNYAIFGSSSHQSAAWKLVQYLAQGPVELAVQGDIPANIAAAHQYLMKNVRDGAIVEATIKSGYPRPRVPNYPQISADEQTMIQDILLGMDPQKAADKAAKAMDAQLARLQH